ncbi:MAG: NADP-dependent 3-hydroxy acid dehydrogenase YdfG [Actinomycetia bacterium]|nr:NADP-dependent 3-hydroxy acid dehydrogenase YdfG [Actinomycetes bacterium]
MSETTWFITGASSGLGYALAEHVLKQGERVAMGARTLGPMSDLAKRYPRYRPRPQARRYRP